MRDPKAATDLLRAKVAGGNFWLTGKLARRIAEGAGTARDPSGARALLTLTSLGDMIGEDAYLLGTMRERGGGGAVDLPGAVAAYRKGARHQQRGPACASPACSVAGVRASRPTPPSRVACSTASRAGPCRRPS